MTGSLTVEELICKPPLKWAGGKRQLLPQIRARFPKKFNKYIEPFVGGGAVFFGNIFENAVIGDANQELIMMYQTLRDDVEGVIAELAKHVNDVEHFYRVRALNWRELPNAQAAARMIYLNRTCFNGLYRVNKKDQFNVPFGGYKNPRFLDEDLLRNASMRLRNSIVECADYKDLLSRYAEPNDLVFLDPPYVPVSKYSDFKRYNAIQFSDEDQEELAATVHDLNHKGVSVILTNSNHETVHTLYREFKLTVLETKRNISSKSSTRTGQDVIIEAIV